LCSTWERKKNSNSLSEAQAKETDAMKHFLLCVLIIGLLAAPVNAQQPTVAAQAQSKERRGTIRGRVVNDSGQGLANVSIGLFPASAIQSQRRMVGTDEDGRFEVDDLAPAVFSIVPNAPGYVLPASAVERRYYRIGDEVTITMIKGGVITGMVKNAAGEPLVGVLVSPVRVRDAEGKPSTRSANAPRDRMTDDRGTYRIYGLEPGAYLISAGGRSNFYMGSLNKYAEDVKTYHPSATRDTATEVMVQNGQEVSGIDINYRGGKGHTISGTIANVGQPAENAAINVSLIQAVSSTSEANEVVMIREGNLGFALYGVTDGEYLIRAERLARNNEKTHFSSPPRRISVKGNDVSGIELALAPLASISGVMVLEQTPVSNSRAQCEKQRLATLEEMVLSFRKDTKNEGVEQRWLNMSPPLMPDEKGEFSAYRLSAGSYRLSVDLPSQTWYIKSQTLSAAAKSNQPNYRNQQPSDVAAKGIALRAGEQLAGLTITIAEGAASVSGVVKAASEREALPPRLRVYLVPGERENANEVLRFFQAEVQFDGAFSFNNVPPGKYWGLARIGNEESLSDNLYRPLYWDLEGRAQLVKEAAGENSLLELQPCKKLTDFVLRHGLPKAVVAPAIKK
jgi:hypothetical protein